MKTRYRYNPATDEVEQIGVAGRTNGIVPPKHCEALGFVSEAEVTAAKELEKKIGLGDVEYDDDCRPVFRSSADYEKYLSAYGYVNKSSCGRNSHFTPAMFEQMKQRVVAEYDALGSPTPEIELTIERKS